MAGRIKVIRKSYFEEPLSRKRKKSVTEQSRIGGRRPHVGEIIIFGFVILLLSAATYWRNGIWNSEIELMIDCVNKSPNKGRPHNNLGQVFLDQGRDQEAIAQFTEALRVDPNHPAAHHNLGNALVGQGRYQEAIAQFTEALRINPNYAATRYNLGSAYVKIGDRISALEEYEILKTMNPDMASALYKKIR
jgi:tetratricopeptide (TPR) repeat protein